MGSHCKGQTHVHAAAVALDRCIDEAFHLGKGDDVIESRPDLGPAHAEYRAIEKDVLATGQFGMKTGAHLKHARDAPAQHGTPASRLGNPPENLEQGRFAGSVPSDDAEHLAPLDLEAHVAQRPKFLYLIALHDLVAANEIRR